MKNEYYVVRRYQSEQHALAWELLRYNPEGQLTGTGKVCQLANGKFESDDIAFQSHKNEHASRRIRIIKRHLELGEPSHTCYWSEKGGKEISYFKA